MQPQPKTVIAEEMATFSEAQTLKNTITDIRTSIYGSMQKFKGKRKWQKRSDEALAGE